MKLRGGTALAAGAALLALVSSATSSVAATRTTLASPELLYRPPRPVPFTPTSALSFQGLGPCEQYASTYDCWTPGEPVVAVGPSDIIETVNEAAAVYSKTGSMLAEFDFGTFWGGTDSDPTQCTDPRALYIAGAGRFAISCSSTSMRFAISETSDPTGAWYRYAAPNTAFLDQDKIEATSDKFIIAGNTSSNEAIYVYNLSDVVAGVASPSVVMLTATHLNIYQTTIEQTATSNGYLVGNFPGNVLSLATVSGTPAANDVQLTETYVTAKDYPAPHQPAVPGGYYDAGDGRVLDAIYETEASDGKPVIQFSTNRQCGKRDCITSGRIDLSGSTPVATYNYLAGEPGKDYTYGAVGLDAAGDVFESYSRSSNKADPGVGILGPGFDVPVEAASSGSSACSSGNTGCTERWGDYLGTSIDPSNTSQVWYTGLYQAGAGGYAWGTLIGAVSVSTYALPEAVTDSASDITGSGATIAGTVYPRGLSTTYHFDYGTQMGYDYASSPASAGSGTGHSNFSLTLTGLQPDTLYHYRIVATTSTGSALGADKTFRTLGPSISSVTFSGSSSDPTVTIDGSNFGSEPSGVPAGCNDSGKDFGSSLWFSDTSTGVSAGQNGDCVGLVVTSYTSTHIVYGFGSNYAMYAPIASGDGYTLSVRGAEHSGTVAY